MSNKGIIKWNHSQLKSIKRDLLFFDELYYDPFLVKLQIDLLKNVSKLIKKEDTITNEIDATINFLESSKILNKFELNDVKNGKIKLDSIPNQEKIEILEEVKKYDPIHTKFLSNYQSIVELFEKDYNKALLKYINLLTEFGNFADYHVRLSSVIMQKSTPNDSVIPIIENTEGLFEGKKQEVIRLTINNLPIPSDLTPLDEVIDFKNTHQRIYFGLKDWINKVSSSSLNINEINDQVQFYTHEFEHRMKLENTKYQLTTFEAILTAPIEIIEKVIKLNWSKIPDTLLKVKKNRLDLLIGETKAPGREMAYIVKANEKFNPK